MFLCVSKQFLSSVFVNPGAQRDIDHYFEAVLCVAPGDTTHMDYSANVTWNL